MDVKISAIVRLRMIRLASDLLLVRKMTQCRFPFILSNRSDFTRDDLLIHVIYGAR